MKKIGLLIIGMLIIVAFCGKKGDDSLEKRGEQKKQTFLEKTKENYSEHIKIYDRILNIDKGLLYYFEDAGMEREFRKIDADDIEVNIGVDQALIDKLKSIKDSKEKKSELDKKAIAMLPALETMLPIVNEMKTYYVQKGYKVDNFVKAQEYHTRLLAVTEKFKQVERPYKELFDKKSSCYEENETRQLIEIINNFNNIKDKKRLVDYSNNLLNADEYDLTAIIQDDSMKPKYNKGDRVYINFGYDFTVGDIYLIEYDNSTYIRKVFNDGYRVRLISLNDEYEPINIDIPIEKQFNIIGKVIGKKE